MIDLRVELKADATLNFLGAIESQLPYATSVAINNTLNDIQAAERAHVRDAFTLRRPEFIERTIYIGRDDRATKAKLTGTVRINPARDFLAKFEDDTAKRPRSAAALAVPVFRQDNPTMVLSRSDPLNVKQLMRSLDKRRGRFKAQKGQKQRDVQSRVFLVKNAKGTFLVGRLGSQTRVLYAFKKSVPITPVLRFKAIALNAALRAWPDRAAQAMDIAIRTAR